MKCMRRIIRDLVGNISVVVTLLLLLILIFQNIPLRNVDVRASTDIVEISQPEMVVCKECGNTSHNFRIINTFISQYDPLIRDMIDSLAERNASWDDEEVIQLIRMMIDPPSRHISKMSKQVMVTPQSTEIDTILKQMKKGFFVECGAFDGERSSNTMFFEKNRNWNGLLIEMDPFYYTQLRGKNRRAWSINSCLSITRHLTKMTFAESSGGAGRLVTNSRKSATNTLVVPCFPLESLLKALNQSTVNYFSLDVEGLELDVLKTIDFSKVHINTLSVEYRHGVSKATLKQYMEAKGYAVHKDIQHANIPLALYVDDYIFIKIKAIFSEDK